MNDVNQKIKAWLSNQPYWVQLAAIKIYMQERINDDFIETLLDLLKGKISIQEDDKISLESIFTDSESVTDVIYLSSVGDIEGIDALKPKTPLGFSPKLSVIYGHNGSGKSGYTRILKKICGKPNARELISNVFKNKPSNSQCTIIANINGNEEKFIWKSNTLPIDQLRSIDIFDSQTGFFYIDKEQEVSYLPREVALFEGLVNVFQGIQEKLKLESSTIKTKLPSRPLEFGVNNKYIIAMFDRLKYDSDVEVVENFFNFDENDTKELKKLEERLVDSPIELEHKKRKRVDLIENFIKQISSAIHLVSQQSIGKIIDLEKEAQHKRSVAHSAAAIAVNNNNFEGIGSDVWKAMWQAAQKYSQIYAYPDETYPVVKENSKCVLCEQELNEVAKKRFISFDNYITGDLELSATTAEDKLQKLLNALPIKPDNSILMTNLHAMQLDEEKWLPIINEIWTEIIKVVDNIKNKERLSIVYYNLSENIFDELKVLAKDLRDEIVQHQKDIDNFDIKSIQENIQNIRAKIWANGYIQAIKDEILGLQKKQKIDEWLKQVNPRAISLEAGKVSELVVTDAFISRFQIELNALGADHIQVELVKSRIEHGRVKHKIQLSGVDIQHGAVKAIDILSEGEQRIVALAAFLADMTSKVHSAPFIFDDPISSLDQKYEEYTVKRLVELSSERQVIIFTHRLSLVGLLIDSSEVECRYIKREVWGAGEHSDIPLFANKPIKAIKDLQNGKLQRAKKVLKEYGSEEYYPLAKAICSDFRILLERIIEYDLLADVLARHRRAINTQGKLHKIAAVSIDDCDLIIKLMTDLSRYEHSQSLELPVDVPTPEILTDLLATVIQWHEEFTKRVK